MLVSFEVIDDSGRTWAVVLRQREGGHKQIIVSDLQTGGEVQFDERSLLLALYESNAFPLSSSKPVFKDLPKP